MADWIFARNGKDVSERLRSSWKALVAQVERSTGRGDGEDLLHDAYVCMADRVQPPENAEAFLVHSAVNRANDSYRREEVRMRNHADAAMALLYQSAPLQDEALIMRTRLERVSKGIEQLPPRTREVFLLQRIEGYKYREIAEELAISQKAVEKHMTKAMKFLGDWTRDW